MSGTSERNPKEEKGKESKFGNNTIVVTPPHHHFLSFPTVVIAIFAAQLCYL